MQMELEINKVSKSYERKLKSEYKGSNPVKKAIQELSLTLNEGIYGLMGPNGAGKTTLINMMVGLLKPDSGYIHFNGQDIHKMGKDYRNFIGYMPQQQWIYESMSCKQFLTYMGALKGLSGKNGRHRVDEVLSQVNLSTEQDKKVGALSGGMKQRLLIAQAILNDPRILILDEPTAGVDPNERIRIRNLISEISFNKIVLIATHVVSDIEFISNKFILLKEGNLLFCDNYINLTQKMEGKVFECYFEENELSNLERKYKVVTLLKETDKIKARVIAEDNVVDYQAKKVTPTLEDLYLHLYGKDIN